jgi:uncharacterized protein
MHVAALRIEVHIPDSVSLKDKRKVVRPFVEGLRKVASLSVSEVDHHNTWQRAAFGVAMVAPDAPELERLIERVRRYVDNQLELDVLDVRVSYMEGIDG